MERMLTSDPARREALLDPVDRVSEILFGLIMAVTIIGSVSVASAGRAEVRTAMAAALGCNLAWGLVDAVMYLVRTLTERTRNRSLAARVRHATDDVAHRLIERSLPPHVAAISGSVEVEGMRRRLLALPDATGGLRGEDFLAAFGIFLLVVLATFPVALPFIVIGDAALAMRVSQGVAVAMLLGAGFVLGRHAGHSRPILTGSAMALLGVALIASVKALGG
jgi:VIT1/CCC1 family predicted Fe2+/Mn2+ transporter